MRAAGPGAAALPRCGEDVIGKPAPYAPICRAGQRFMASNLWCTQNCWIDASYKWCDQSLCKCDVSDQQIPPSYADEQINGRMVHRKLLAIIQCSPCNAPDHFPNVKCLC